MLPEALPRNLGDRSVFARARRETGRTYVRTYVRTGGRTDGRADGRARAHARTHIYTRMWCERGTFIGAYARRSLETQGVAEKWDGERENA